MKILSPKQLREVETETVNQQDIELINLMERAATSILNWLKQQMDLPQRHFTIVCGTGNNGGDGLALARLLASENAHIKVYLQENNSYSLDNLTNQKKLKDAKVIIDLYNENTELEFISGTIIIDAIFGYGLNRPISEEWKPIINQINSSPNSVLSIDVPSGLFCDQLNGDSDAIVESEITLTLETPKLALLLPENEKYVNHFEILPIFLDAQAIQKQPSNYQFVGIDFLPAFYRKRSKFAHKYQFGNVLVIAGSYGKIGAAVMSSKAALKSGCGLVTAYIPKCGYGILQTSFPEAMVLTDLSEETITNFPKVERFDTIAIGPGIGTDQKTELAFEQFLNEQNLENKNLILDADALNLLAKNKELLTKLPKNTVLTPHDGELERLIGSWDNSFDKLGKLKNFTKKYQLFVVSKGTYTQIFFPDGQVYFNSTGNPGMATAGSGDVLTGIIAGQIAKKYEIGLAIIYGVFLHGYAGDVAAKTLGEESLTAGDIIKHLSVAYKELFT